MQTRYLQAQRLGWKHRDSITNVHHTTWITESGTALPTGASRCTAGACQRIRVEKQLFK